jgi:triacylglycerol esterase/lipase EstA (alpha/beta hydrolase family)
LILGKKTIIGIHGLDNKPEPAVLSAWWKASIEEGLARHGAGRKPKFRFELVYWADLIYPEPADPASLTEPYVPAAGEGPLPRGGLSVTRMTAARVREGTGRVLARIFKTRLAENRFKDALWARMPDLHSYKQDESLREAVQARLLGRLRAARRWRRPVMLIAHSMGSIIAYDVLREAEHTLPRLRLEHLVTVGSPLGLGEFGDIVERPLHVPECVMRWSNLADPKDQVARWDAFLSEGCLPNKKGVTISDRLVVSGYVNPAGAANPHKVYGYLRTPEMSELIVEFAR